MRHQLLKLGCNFDWNREVSTSDPSYYKWTQWLFIQLFNAGLVKQKRSFVNWDPVDQTVLAKEQIDSEGRSWRSGAVAERKLLKQWFVRITRYAHDLYTGLDNLSQWDDIVLMQRNWIGKCEVYKFHVPLALKNGNLVDDEEIEICLDNPMDILSLKKIHVTTEHILWHLATESGWTRNENFPFQAINPLTQETVPVCPNDSPSPLKGNERSLFAELESSRNVGSNTSTGMDEILSANHTPGWGGYKGSEKLEDWVVSRQKYWGTPIPIIHCPSCKAVPVPDEDLPVKLPVLKNFERGATKGSPLELAQDWKITTCPKCGNSSVRETDTLDTFFDSAWYFLRYLDPKNDSEIFSCDVVNEWMPVNIYVGGKEHAVLHLFFARFITHFLRNRGYLVNPEPFERLLPQGIVKGVTYQNPETKKFVPADQVKTEGTKCFHSDSGEELEVSWQKMSKSKHNGVNPLDMLERFGTDMTRLVTISGVSPQSDRNWDPEAFRGIQNWLNRVLWVVRKYSEVRTEDGPSTIDHTLEATLKENYNYFVRLVSHHIEKTFLFNVAISRLQGLTNSLRKVPETKMRNSMEFERCVHSLIIMLSIFAPHLSAELWENLQLVPALQPQLWKKECDIWEQSWPELDADAEFDLLVMTEDTVIDTVRIERKKLAAMTCSEALLLAYGRSGREKMPKAAKHLLDDYIWDYYPDSIDTKLEQIGNYGATLSLSKKNNKVDL